MALAGITVEAASFHAAGTLCVSSMQIDSMRVSRMPRRDRNANLCLIESGPLAHSSLAEHHL